MSNVLNSPKKPDIELKKSLTLRPQSTLDVKLPNKSILTKLKKIEILALCYYMNKKDKEIHLICYNVDKNGTQKIICSVNLFKCNNVSRNDSKLKITILSKYYNEHFKAPNCSMYQKKNTDITLIIQQNMSSLYISQRNDMRAFYELVQIIHENSSMVCVYIYIFKVIHNWKSLYHII